MTIRLNVKGLDKVMEAFEKFPDEITKYIAAAGEEVANRLILNEPGLGKYPPATAANYPPTPYYIRGRGTQYKNRNRGNSQRLGTRWYVESERRNYATRIGNTASYGPYVVGEQQARFMAAIGWKRLDLVAEEKQEQAAEIYQAWVDKLIDDLGL